MDSTPYPSDAMSRKSAELSDSITATRTKVQAFARLHREARADLNTLSHQLVDLSDVVDLWSHDAADDGTLSDVAHASFPQLERILAHCLEVLQDIETLLGNAKSGDWSAPVQKEMDGIFKQIDAYTLSLNAALDMAHIAAERFTYNTDKDGDSAAHSDDEL